ncbi:MAG TPA: hypothetical protein VMF90_21840 [Rhizobiaceae bacterium]|nr:hypothetical protein [Rhizobiaceae bacterium]
MNHATSFLRFHWLSALIASPFAILLWWLVTAMIDRQPPIIYEGVRPITASVAQGASIELEFRVFRLRICEATAKRWLYDSAGQKHAIPSYTVGPAQLAGLVTYRRSITIPEAAALGQATYQVELSYICNLIHRLGWPILVTSPPIRFEVTPRPIIILPPLLSAPNDDDG